MSTNRTLVIGDIHGALKALMQCLERAEVSKEDTIILLGDYVDGWSESGEVLDYLMELETKHKCVFIRGNHDVFCVDYLKGKEMSANWLIHGGSATITCYENNHFNKADHIEFLVQLKNYYIDNSNRLFIHAGFSNMSGPTKETYESNYYWDRTLWETALAFDDKINEASVFYPKRFKLFKEIYIGHTSILKYGTDLPINKLNLWNMDTGAAYTGKLTIMDIDSKEIWQSDVVQTLYPNEKGRN